MGKVLSLISRPVKNYNVEARAHKIISHEKPTVAPKHKATITEINRLKKEYPDVESKIHEKNDELYERLRDVYVKSFDTEPIIKNVESKTSKILPLNRSQVEEFEYGFKEPEVVTPGKATLRQILQLLSDHETNPKENTVEQLSKQYNLNVQNTKNILHYFRMYQIHIPAGPDTKKTDTFFATPIDSDSKLLKSESDIKKD